MADDEKKRLGDGADTPSGITKAVEGLPREIAEVLRQQSVQNVNVNVLLVQLTKQTESNAEFIANSERVLEITEKFEKSRLEHFQRQADAIISVKIKDPDEIEKRASNRARRVCKYVLAGLAVAGLAGGLAVIVAGGNIIAALLLLGIAAVATAMLAPLASGESITAGDVVRIIGAVREAASTASSESKKGKQR